MTFPKTLFLFSFQLLLLATTATAKESSPCKPDWAEPGATLICERLGETQTGDLGSGEGVVFNFDLQPGTYSFAGWAGLDLAGLTMTVTDLTGAVLKSDKGTENQPICEITLSGAKMVKVALKAGELRAGIAGSYAFVAAKGTGCFAPVPCPGSDILDGWVSVIKESSQSIIKWQIMNMSGTGPTRVSFSLPSGNFTAIAETMDSRDDIDIVVKKGSEALCSNEEPDNNPICDFTLAESSDITLEFTSSSYGNGNSATVVIVIATNRGEE